MTSAIGAALDAGARAVIVPQVESAADAQRAVAAAFYPPIGRRSWGPLGRMWDGPTLTVEEANRSTTCAVMIESAQALSQVEEIAAVDGVGQLFVGPHDLSLSLGTTVRRCSMTTRSQALLRGSCRSRRRTVARWVASNP